MRAIRGGLLSAIGGALLVLLLITAAALAATGDLTQPPGAAGCVSQEETRPCADGHALDGPYSVAVSPDGKSVYVASFPYSSNAVVRLNRNPTTGAIAQPAGAAGCVSQQPLQPCADGHALDGPYSVAVSPDGKSVYVASYSSNAVARLNRNPTTGALTQPAGAAGCVSENGAGPCGDGHGLVGPVSVAVSPDGKSVYVASSDSSGCAETTCGGWGAVARLNRNPTTGAIAQPAGRAGCVSETGAEPCADGHGLLIPYSVAVSPDGKSVYVASFSSEAVARLNRNPTTGALTQPAGAAGCVSEDGSGPCADGHAIDGPVSVAVSPDGKSVYAASGYDDAVVRLIRNPTTGAIAQPAGRAGCVSENGAGPCGDGHGLVGPVSVAVSPDGKSVYVASFSSHAVARLNRNATTGAIAQPAGRTGCVSQTGAGLCDDGHALVYPHSVAVSPDGKSVYSTSGGSKAVVRFNRAP
jgi:DNA-binding beta-propeller fold protein YncE